MKILPLTHSIDLQPLFRFYDELLDKPLDDAQTANWRSEESQESGFRTITRVLDGATGSFSVYDVGCGPAALRDYLQAHYPLARYKGCDINPRMIARAKSRRPGADVECRNILVSPPEERYDFVLASGTFNQHGGAPANQWLDFVLAMLRAMYAMATRAVAVTLQSSFAQNADESDFCADPSAMLAFAQRELTPLAQLDHSFSPAHFSMFLYRPEPTS